MPPLSKPTPPVHTHTNKLPSTLGLTLQLRIGWLEMGANATKLDPLRDAVRVRVLLKVCRRIVFNVTS